MIRPSVLIRPSVMIRVGLVCGAAAAMLALSMPEALAQTRTITTIVPFGPGGAPDTIARLLGEQIANAHGVTMVVENRPGAGSIIGTEAALRRGKPDGNTLLIMANALLINPHLRKVNYHPLTDFEPICHLASSPSVLAVDAKSPHRTLDDLLKAARDKPGTVSISSPGPATVHHLIVEGVKRQAKVEVTYVPYDSAGPAIAAVLGRHVTAVLTNHATLVGQLKSGQLRALVVSASSRMAALPDVPTLTESGLTGMEWESWFGLVTSAQTPKDVTDELIGWYGAALKDKAVTSKLAAMDMIVKPVCGTAFGALLKQNGDAFGEIIREAGIKLKKK